MKPSAPLPLHLGGFLAAVALCLNFSPTAHGGESNIAVEKTTLAAPLSDLTLSNFFTEGWDQPWAKRAHPGGTPDMALLRVQTNFLEREFRFDFYSTQQIHDPRKRNIQFIDGLVAYGLNRRFMMEVISNYEWLHTATGHDSNGAGAAFLGRVQLIDTANASYAFNIRAAAPDTGIGEKQTTLAFALAGWHDLTPLGLPRVGLYYHVQEETYAGPSTPGTRQNDFTYDLSLAKTWTSSERSFLGNFTTFLESFGATNIDGDQSGKTIVTLTPGVRFNLTHNQVLIGGVDIPVTNPHPYGETYRVSYVYNF